MSDWMTAPPDDISDEALTLPDKSLAEIIGNDDSYMWNIEAGFKQRMAAFLAASGGRIEIISGFRSVEHQQRLWDAEIAEWMAKGYSESEAAEYADNWVARPGTSNHNRGLAMDLSFVNDEAKRWAHSNAAKFGLEFPMSWEPWHIEPLGLAKGSYPDFDPERGAYTAFTGAANPVDVVDSLAALSDVFNRAFSLGPTEDSTEPTSLIEEEQVADDG